MKKIYTQPKLNVVELEENVVIATSTVHNFGFDGGTYVEPEFSEKWEWN